MWSCEPANASWNEHAHSCLLLPLALPIGLSEAETAPEDRLPANHTNSVIPSLHRGLTPPTLIWCLWASLTSWPVPSSQGSVLHPSLHSGAPVALRDIYLPPPALALSSVRPAHPIQLKHLRRFLWHIFLSVSEIPKGSLLHGRTFSKDVLWCSGLCTKRMPLNSLRKGFCKEKIISLFIYVNFLLSCYPRCKYPQSSNQL